MTVTSGQLDHPARLKFSERELLPIQVKCDIHLWESAYWMILDHPFATKTASDGSFKIENVPFGKHQFTLWHERIGYVVKIIDVDVDSPAISLPDFVLTAERLQERDQQLKSKR